MVIDECIDGLDHFLQMLIVHVVGRPFRNLMGHKGLTEFHVEELNLGSVSANSAPKTQKRPENICVNPNNLPQKGFNLKIQT